LKTNAKVVYFLNRIADYLELEGNQPFKISAYRKAAQAVDQLVQPIEQLQHRLESIEGVGKGIASVILEIIQEGKASMLEELMEQIPAGLPALLRIPGLGPKTVRTLYKRLGISSIKQLEEAARHRKIRELPGFGPKTEGRILDAIHRAAEMPEYIPLGVALPIAEKLVNLLSHHPNVHRVSLAGSLRRMKETVKNIDIVLSTDDPASIINYLDQIPFVKELNASGVERIGFLIEYGWPMHVDIRIVKPEHFASALYHFTGTMEYHAGIKTISPPDLAEESTAWGFHETEESIFEELGLPFMPPEIRESERILERIVAERSLPRLIELGDVRGDLHMHTVWSDGSHSIEEMAEAARDRGYEYVAITDHSRSLKIARGLSVEKLQKQHSEVKELNKKWDDFHVLTGVEMDILSEGILDYPDELLKEMDFVIGSIHTGFRQSEEQLTNRMVQAIENLHVDMIAHPTGRKISRREPYPITLKTVLEAARKTDTAMEINANPNRLDLKAEYARMAKEEYGVFLAINTDAHDISEMDHMKYGLAMARRGWLEEKDVINTMTFLQLQRWLKRNE
jgi:DNA polymerase (family 10)